MKSELSKIYQFTIDEKPNNLLVCKFIKTGDNLAQLNIFENNDGTTTLHYAVGQNQELSKKIAEEIVSISAVKDFKSHSFYIKSIRNEDFETVLEIIIDYGNTIEDKIEDGKKTIIKVKGKQGDRIVLTKHSNNAFQVQGRPMLLFNEIIEVLSDFMAFEEIIEQQLSFYETNLTTADIRGELEAKLPKSFHLIEDKIKVIFTPCLALQKIAIELEDYSAFAYPSLRALEGILKQIFLKFNKKINYKEGFGEYILKQNNVYYLESNFDKELNNSATGIKICNLYKYYNIHRHSLFHIDDDIISSKVISSHEANNIITASLSIIDECYDCLK
ncbi:type II toxin-antitoxin system RnlA family toxin [Flavobacterium psychrophilum]|uniref:type II toxin-antitoxin system RnlA family toxin n=2 Tax=Flavobacterium psychrophilum TaxID=96345 RepID=UPI0009B86170|nr:type II toxin-antitoxin system RnlA family toxin [Flavobacterium psychrophilum]MCB5981798.1 type II toxin-antitoxin system RnlA family toxin [Flavobacterium psychrophilum]MCB5984611.1 type II toxin-antitoxin system RnlA family toxin [Flavobacterium psychrophilum]MCB5987310.1 type II toxin-antitoxin system RnlA family toxin [Flavobacterium psychrophilum]MCB5989820.1 type II toxin-antitoxin system RnlA family toxin [Flavobacterium psychrophilum]MCB6000528.1 type II toxin-antitoxin system RnlA